MTLEKNDMFMIKFPYTLLTINFNLLLQKSELQNIFGSTHLVTMMSFLC